MAKMQYRVLGTSGMKVSQLCLGTMMFGGPTEARPGAAASSTMRWRAASTSSTRPTSTPRDARRRSIGPAIKAKRNRWVLATKVAQKTGPDVTDAGLSRRHIDAGRRGEPEAAADRLHRPLLHPPRRPRHGLGADHCRLRRPDPPGQDPRVGPLQRARLAHPPRRPPLPPARRAAARPRCSPTTTS